MNEVQGLSNVTRCDIRKQTPGKTIIFLKRQYVSLEKQIPWKTITSINGHVVSL